MLATPILSWQWFFTRYVIPSRHPIRTKLIIFILHIFSYHWCTPLHRCVGILSHIYSFPITWILCPRMAIRQRTLKRQRLRLTCPPNAIRVLPSSSSKPWCYCLSSKCSAMQLLHTRCAHLEPPLAAAITDQCSKMCLPLPRTSCFLLQNVESTVGQYWHTHHHIWGVG